MHDQCKLISENKQLRKKLLKDSKIEKEKSITCYNFVKSTYQKL